MNTKKREITFIVLLSLMLVVLMTVSFWNYTQDDVFITYTYSRNIAEGNGFVFFPGERVQGTTTPLWTIFIAGVYFVTPDLLHAGNFLSAIFLFSISLLAFFLLRDHLSIYSRIALVLLITTSPFVYVSFGMETLLYSFLLFLSFFSWSIGNGVLAIIFAGLLTWTRADGLVLGGALILDSIITNFKAQTKEGKKNIFQLVNWKLVTIYFLTILPWFVFAWFYFGSPLPNTFQAKQELFHDIDFLIDGFSWWKAFYGNNLISCLAIPLIIVGLIKLWQSEKLRLITIWTVAYITGYTILNVTMFWYYTPLILALIVLSVIGGDTVFTGLKIKGQSRSIVKILLVIMILVSSYLGVIKALDYAVPPPRTLTYKLLGQWINEHTNADDRLLVLDLGIVGYYAQRSTVDTPGLIVPDMNYYWEDGYSISKYRPDLIVTTQYWSMVRLVEQPWFSKYYAPIVKYSTPSDEFSPMTVYSRRFPIENVETVVQGNDFALNTIVNLEEGIAIPDSTQVRLYDSNNNLVYEDNRSFLENTYPSIVPNKDDVVIEQVVVSVELSPGVYRWEMECDEIKTGELSIVPFNTDEGFISLDKAIWQGISKLRGFRLYSSNDIWSGGEYRFVLYWQALTNPTNDFSVFVHLVDENGLVVAQADGYPRNGSRPFSTWEDGEVIADTRSILIPADLQSGQYQIVIGIYDWQTGERVDLVDGLDSFLLPVEIGITFPAGSSGLP